MAKALITRTPYTVSCRVLVRLAISSCWRRLMLRSPLPMRMITPRLAGMSSRASRVIFQLMIRATARAMTMYRGSRTRVVKLTPTHFWAMSTSLVARLMSSPALFWW